MFVDEPDGTAWIGYNSNVANVNLHSCRMNCAVDLGSVFFAILGQMHDGSVVAIHELGATRVSRLGEVIWTCPTEIVTDFSDEGKGVRLQTDIAEIRIDKETGARQ